MSLPDPPPPDPTIGELVGDGDTTPPDEPYDPLDPEAPTNAPAPKEEVQP